jgi:RsmE family RNA methyltransferase
MNLLLLKPHEIRNQQVELTDRRAEHIRKVLRAGQGDEVRVGVVNGPMGLGRILLMEDNRVTLSLCLTVTPSPPPATDLILALPRPIMLKRVLAQAASLGVSRIFLINAGRVEKSFFHASLIRDNTLEGPLLLGLEQAVDTILPQISVHERFRPFVEDLLPGLLPGSPTRLLAHPDGGQTLARLDAGTGNQRIILAIGPEGGWVDFEVHKFQEQGFTLFSMGPRILRVDTAVPALLGQIGLLRQLAGDGQTGS